MQVLPYSLGSVRDLETIDAELRLLAAVRPSIREQGGEPGSRQVDELLDERLNKSVEANRPGSTRSGSGVLTAALTRSEVFLDGGQHGLARRSSPTRYCQLP